MAWFCKHDWVVIRQPTLDLWPYSNHVIYRDIVIKNFRYQNDAIAYQKKHSDSICAKCEKLNLNTHKLDKIIDKRNREKEASLNRSASRIKAKELGEKLLKLKDKAKQ